MFGTMAASRTPKVCTGAIVFSMLEQVLKTIARFRMILPGQQIAVACSGGPDSTALLLILHELSDRLGCGLSVCHFNHRLRGEQSDEDELFVQRLAERLRLPLHSQRADVRHSAQNAHANLEGTARKLRYGFLLSLVQQRLADRVAVGHTADDQAETVLHRLLRGAGTRGLAGIHPVVEGQIVRPLLGLRRQALRDWLTARKQEWREDASNLDLQRTRNRIRHQVLPLLSQFNPRIVETFSDMAELAGDEEAFWKDYLQPIVVGSTSVRDREIIIDIGRLRQQPAAVARRVLRWAVEKVAETASEQPSAGLQLGIVSYDDPGLATGAPTSASAGVIKANSDSSWSRTPGADFEQVQRLLDLALEGRSGTSISLPNKVVARKEFLHLIIVGNEHAERKFEGYSHQIRVPAKVEVPEIGSLFSFELVSLPRGQTRYNSNGKQVLDVRLAATPLTLRNWQHGDGYRPMGHRKRTSLKEFFQRNRVSASLRQAWPVVLAGDEIVWARGLEVAEGFGPDTQSEQAILIEEYRM